MAIPEQNPLFDKYYTGYFSDIGTSGSIFIPIGGRGKIKDIFITPIVTCATTATIVTSKISGVNITNGVVTLTATQAAGTTQRATPSSLNEVNAGDTIELATDGGTTTTSPAFVTIVVREITA